MSFVWPLALIGFALLPVCIVVYRRLQQRRARNARNLGALGGTPGGAPSPLRRRHLPPLLYLLGLALLAFASARPMITMPVPRLEGTVVLAFDVSASMGADDVEPSRMEAAKTTALELVERRPDNVRIGAVAFGETGMIAQQPTYDREAIVTAVARLVHQSGRTSLAQGILSALAVIQEEISDPGLSTGDAGSASKADMEPRSALAPAIIVLLTDGEHTEPQDPAEAAQTAIEHGVRVYTVGIGTPEGATVEVDGFYLSTELNEPVLQEIALITEGTYFKVEGLQDTPPVYDNLDTQFVVKPQEVELTPFLSAGCVIALLAGAALSLAWFGRVP